MKKIGIAVLTLLALATAACAESPAGIPADAARAALKGGAAAEGYAREEGTTKEAAVAAPIGEDTGPMRLENPGLGLSGNRH